MPHGAERPRYAAACRETARSYGMQRNRTMPRGAEGPRDATSCRGTARRCVVQRDSAMPRGAEGPQEATRAETARSYGVPRDRAMLQ